MDWEIDWRIGSGYTGPLQWRRSWAGRQSCQSQIQAAEMIFICRVGSLDIWEELGVELLLLHIKRSQLRRFRHLVRIPFKRLPGEVIWACPSWRRSWGRPRTDWRVWISHLVKECLSILLEEVGEVAWEKSVGVSLLRLLPLRLSAGEADEEEYGDKK